jgi:anaerobic dimethyl sulfoxide reductase subunit A
MGKDSENVLLETERRGLTRRSFIKWSSILASSAALSGAAGCGFEGADGGSAAVEAEEGHWVSVQCWSDCGSRGFNKVFVKDGKPVRLGTDSSIEDTPDCPQVRSCARGRASKLHVFSADRLKYPMKRKNWQAGGGENSHGELRGKDEWERISWEEALDIIAGEIERIVSTYGNDAIAIPGNVTALFGQWDVGRMMTLYGGYLDNWGSCSSGAWGSIAPYTGLLEDLNDRLDVRNSDLIVLWGYNPAWSRAGLPAYYYEICRQGGTRFISIDPFRNATSEALSEEWYPVRPGTDVALALGMAYAILEEDTNRSGALIDWDFLNRCCVGFDAEHLPEGADPKENFKDYVLGTYDGVPKTPQWASEICGTPADDIQRVAIEIAETEKVGICMAPAPARTTNGSQLPQTILALGAMSGCIGKSGCMCGSDAGHTWLMEGKSLVLGGYIQGDPSWTTAGGKELLINPVGGNSLSKFTGTPNGMYTRPTEPYYRVNVNELWTSVLNGKYRIGKDEEKECNIHMYWHTHSNLMNQAPGTMLAIEAHRKVDFVLTQNMVMTTSAKYSDIVLPITSQWEREGDLTQGYREHILISSQATEPLFEAKDDMWVAEELGRRLGVDMEQLSPFDYHQERFNIIAASTVINDDGETYMPLCTITQEDIDERGVEGSPQEGRIPIKQFEEDGIYRVPRAPGDNFSHIVLKAFRDDPEANSLPTKTGKLEIYSELLAEDLNACGWESVKPLPQYKPAVEGYEETFSDWATKTKGEYPLQLITIHGLRFAHSTFGNVPVLREMFDHPLYINPIDAEAYGVRTGDTALVTSKWGKVLRPVLTTDIMMPGVVAITQGAWVEIDEETGIDKAGCVNVLVGPNLCAFGHQAFNSCIVKVERWTGDKLVPDAQWEPREMFKEG